MLSKEEKVIVFNAYLNGRIIKEEMKFLFEVGLTVPPIPWIFDTEEHEKKHDRKRYLVEKVTGRTFPMITWI